MHDLNRDQIQDLLPEYAKASLAPELTAAVERALREDDGLAAELSVLRRVQGAYAATPAVDYARILHALPTPPSSDRDDLALRRERKRPMISLRFARAAALLVVVGGGTLMTVWKTTGGTGEGSGPAGATVSTMELGFGASTDELSVEQLRALEADIQSLDGEPSAEPETSADLFGSEGA